MCLNVKCLMNLTKNKLAVDSIKEILCTIYCKLECFGGNGSFVLGHIENNDVTHNRRNTGIAKDVIHAVRDSILCLGPKVQITH